ncbi:MAG: hypothetical protein NTY19_48255 [Planctomycetota bacterium]|nr:hypothetical protein [Planctomycetota bacterium]
MTPTRLLAVLLLLGFVHTAAGEGGDVEVLDSFGNRRGVPVRNGKAALQVPPLPVYLRLAKGQRVSPVSVDFGRNLAPDARRVLVSAGSDDGIKIWVNGDLKVSHDLTRGAAPGQEEQPVDLRAGWNEILLKITQGEGGWGFYFDLLTPDRKPMPDLVYSPMR